MTVASTTPHAARGFHFVTFPYLVDRHGQHHSRYHSAFFMIGVIASIGNDETDSRQTKPTSTSTPLPTPTPEISLTATDLITAYEDNKLAADQLYKDEIIIVTGIIEDFGEDLFNDAYITITYDPANMAGWSVLDINCHFIDDDLEKVVQLSKGDAITVKGRNKGDPGFTIVFQECTILSDKPDPTSTATSTPNPIPTSINDPLVFANHREFSRWGIIDAGGRIPSIEIHLPKSDKYNAEYYHAARKLVPCNENTLPTSIVDSVVWDQVKELQAIYTPEQVGLTPFQYCAKGRGITDIIASALERAEFDPSAISQIEVQIVAIRDIDPAGKLEDEHAYFLAFADALEAALPDMESIVAGTPPTDMTRIDAVTDASNVLVPVMQDVCDPSIIN